MKHRSTGTTTTRAHPLRFGCVVTGLFVSLLVSKLFLPTDSRYTGGTYGLDKGKASFPTAMLLTIRTADNSSIRLHLERNENLHDVIPGYFITGRNVSRIHTDAKAQMESYIANDLTASFTVSCEWIGGKCVRVFTGDYRYNGKDYAIQPSTTRRTDGKQHAPVHRAVRRSLHDNSEAEGEIVEVSYRFRRGKSEEEKKKKEDKKRRDQKYKGYKCINLIVVSDYLIYKRFQDWADIDVHEFEYLYLRHLLQMMNGVDVRYKRISHPKLKLCVRLMAYFLATTSDSLWDENIVAGSKVDAKKLASDFPIEYRPLLRPTDGTAALPHYDHSVLLTGHDISHQGRTSTLGYGFMSTMCGFWSVSVTEDRGDLMTTMWIVSHELGHSLGSQHDASGNPCFTHNQYVMARHIRGQTPLTAANHYLFSSCSLLYFSSFVGTMQEIGDANCLNCSEPSAFDSSTYDEYRLGLPGYEYHPDRQCQFIHGQSSFLVREALSWTRLICSIMPCYNPADPSVHSKKRAFDGTPCAPNKACLHGACVSNPNTTTFDQACPYGEQSGVVDTERSLTCNDSTATLCTDTSIWANRVFARRCCLSCKKFTSPTGTKCVDRKKRVGGRTCSSLKGRCYYKEVRDVCCSTCKTACVDKPGRGITCPKLKQFCYVPWFKKQCCNTCKRTTPCVDKSPLYQGRRLVTCQSQVSRCHTKDIQEWCCASCRQYTNGVRQRRQIEGYTDLRQSPLYPPAAPMAYRYTGDEPTEAPFSLPIIHINNDPNVLPDGME